MENSYIMRIDTNNLMCFYYLKEMGIAYKTYEKGRWEKSETIIKGTRSNFTVSLDREKNIYIFCQDSFGDIVLCTNKGGAWQNKVILKNQAGKVYEILITPLITDRGISIIYNMPSAEDKSNYLVFQQMDKEGKWLPATKIDKFIPMNDRFYHVQNITDEHFLLFYQTRTPENSLGYREMTLDRQGVYNAFHTTAYQIVDSTFLTSNDALHVAYISKSMFSCQLVYRKKDSDQFSNPSVIWEGQKIENCLLFFVSNKLYICFLNNNQLFYCVSENRGNTFSKPIRYKNKLCLNPIKAPYISGIPQNENEYFSRQIYVDRNNISDIQMLPDLYEEFYPRLEIPKNIEIQEMPKQNFTSNEISEEIMKLKNLLSLNANQNNDKDKQILKLTTLLKDRSEEINIIELEKKKTSKLLNEEKENLQSKLKMQEVKYEELNNKYKNLQGNIEKDRQSRKMKKSVKNVEAVSLSEVENSPESEEIFGKEWEVDEVEVREKDK